MTNKGVATLTPAAAKLPVTLDTKGRVRTSREQRRLILDEFERSRSLVGRKRHPWHPLDEGNISVVA
jgi:hypothetical protein